MFNYKWKAYLDGNMGNEPTLWMLAAWGHDNTHWEEETKGKVHKQTMEVCIAEPAIVTGDLLGLIYVSW